jgi:glutathione S-transferase
MTIFPLTTLATVIALIVYFVLSLNVGRARTTWNVPAPAMAGHIEFEKRNRVHMNTLEQLVLFLPVLWLSIGVLGDKWTALCGLVWCIGRIVYARAYYADPTKRSAGFGLTMLPTLVLMIATIVSAVRGLSVVH